MKLKSIGIIGGAGPLAGVEVNRRVIRRIQTLYGAWEDKDFPRIHLYSYPFSPMLNPENLISTSSAIADELCEAYDLLELCKAEVVGIACNTLHAFLDERIKARSSFISLINCVHKHMVGFSRVLILGSQTSYDTKLHMQACNAIYPSASDQVKVNNYIVEVLKGNTICSTWPYFLEYIVREYKPDSILLACTELSLLPNAEQACSVPVIDTTDLLAEELVMSAAS